MLHENSSINAIGVISSGQGQVRMDQFTFEEVDETMDEKSNLAVGQGYELNF